MEDDLKWYQVAVVIGSFVVMVGIPWIFGVGVIYWLLLKRLSGL